MKKIMISIFLCLLPMNLLAKTFIREYTYSASEADSKITSRANALEQVKRILLEEIGVYIHSTFMSETTEINGVVRKLTASEIEVISAGITKTEIMEERWDGEAFYIKAKINVDEKDVLKRLATVVQNKQMLTQLQESRKRADEALAEIKRLKQELEKDRAKKQKRTLQQKYVESHNKLSAEDWIQKAWNAHQLNELDNDRRYLQKAIDLDPNNVQALTNLGVSYHEEGDYDKAIKYYKKAAKIDPTAVAPYNNIGNVYSAKRDYKRAIKYYKHAIKLDPDFAEPYHNMGTLYKTIGDCDKAIEYYRKTIRINPNFAASYNSMGMVYIEKENYKKAIECYKKAIDLDPNNVQALMNLGVSYHKEGNYKKAIECYQKALKLNPNNHNIYYNIAMTYGKKGDYDKAIEYLKKAAQLGDKGAQSFLRERGLSW